jgi:hypothetical protein
MHPSRQVCARAHVRMLTSNSSTLRSRRTRRLRRRWHCRRSRSLRARVPTRRSCVLVLGVMCLLARVLRCRRRCRRRHAVVRRWCQVLRCSRYRARLTRVMCHSTDTIDTDTHASAVAVSAPEIAGKVRMRARDVVCAPCGDRVVRASDACRRRRRPRHARCRRHASRRFMPVRRPAVAPTHRRHSSDRDPGT